MNSLQRTTALVVGIVVLGVIGCGQRSAVSMAKSTEPVSASAAQKKEPDAKGDAKPEKSAKAPGAQASDPASSQASGPLFPNDKGGKRLAELLSTAGSVAGQRDKRTTALPLAGPPALEHPDSQPPQTGPAPPLAPAKLTSKPVPVLPHSLAPEAPLTRSVQEPAGLPRREELPISPRVRIDSLDVEKAPPAPLLAQMVPDRASLDDPTRDVSGASALAIILPERSTPTPFLKFTLPDPFEHAQTVRLRTPPAEGTTPSSPGPNPSIP